MATSWATKGVERMVNAYINGGKDVLTCPVTEIHEAKPEATYFEGKKVFAQTHEDKSREFE